MKISNFELKIKAYKHPQIFILCLLCLFIVFSSATLAARSVSITSNKTSLFGEEELTLSASMSGFTTGETIYLKGAFFKEGSTNYFGYTKKDDSWVKNSTTALDQRQVTIGQWDGSAMVRSDFSDSGYSEPGTYSLKLGYYYITSGGNISSVNWSSNILSVALDQPTLTPTDAREVRSESPVVTSIQTTKTPTVVKTTSPKTTLNPSKSSVTPTQALISNNFGKISKEKQSSKPGALEVKEPSPKKSKEVRILGAKDNNFTAFIMAGGLILLISGGSLFALKILKEKGIYGPFDKSSGS